MSTKNQKLMIIPEPLEISYDPGFFNLNGATEILSDDLTETLAWFLKNFLKDYCKLDLDQKSLRSNGESHNNFQLSILNDDNKFKKEGYNLVISKDSIQIIGTQTNGIFYGIQSLMQIIMLLINEKKQSLGVIKIPCMKINDSPRFEWRGFMLDEARHFFGKKTVKKLLDILSLLKFNRFHWHLTDDQGWRIEISKYPLLTEIGSKRKGTVTTGKKIILDNNRKQLGTDNIPVEGFYTKDDIREIIEYAKERYIEIIPEIDLPGHVTAALASYPELGCTGGPYEVSCYFGIFADVLCIGREKAFNFSQAVLEEVMQLFPTKYIHLGGDEAPTIRWKNCIECQRLVQNLKLKNVREIQNYFTSRINSFIKSKQHVLIGWNEILHDNLDSEVICQYWTEGLKELIEYLKKGGRVIMSERTRVYLNYPIELTSLNKTYGYDPVPPGLEEDNITNVLGIEACLWTEYAKSEEMLVKMLFPRILAIGELGWATKSNKDFEWFNRKVNKLENLLRYYNNKQKKT